MDLYFKSHPTNLSAFIAPLAQHENTKYAEAMVRHFRPYALGLCSKEEFEQFKIVAFLHGHNIIQED